MQPEQEIQQILHWVNLHKHRQDVWNLINREFTSISRNEQKHSASSDDVKILNQIPSIVKQRLNSAYDKHRPIFFSRNGLYVGKSEVVPNQYGLFTWIDWEPNSDLCEYSGRAWNIPKLELFLIQFPQFLLNKERYMLQYPSLGTSDPSMYETYLHCLQQKGRKRSVSKSTSSNISSSNSGSNKSNVSKSSSSSGSSNISSEKSKHLNPNRKRRSSNSKERVPSPSKKKSGNQLSKMDSWQLDPTDLNGLLPDIHFSHNVAVYINEPSTERPHNQANCMLWQYKRPIGLDSDCHSPPFRYWIKSCEYIAPFTELLMLYEDPADIFYQWDEETFSKPSTVWGIGKYEQRDYLIGTPGKCQVSAHNVKSPKPPPRNRVINATTALSYVQNLYSKSRLQQEQRLMQARQLFRSNQILNRNNEIREDETTEGKLQQQQPQQQYPPHHDWMMRPQVNFIDGSFSCSWHPHFELIPNPKQQKTDSFSFPEYTLRASRIILKNECLPVLGLMLSDEEFHLRMNEGPQFLFISCEAGFFHGDLNYAHDNGCGGFGTYVWVWLRRFGTEGAKQINMELTSQGYFRATRNIKKGEVLAALDWTRY